MSVTKGEIQKIKEGSKVDVTLTTGGPHVEGYFSGLEKDELKLRSKEDKKDADVTLTSDIIDSIKVEA